MVISQSNKDTKPLSRVIFESIAAVEGIEPAELSPPLYDVIEPEALDELFRTSKHMTPSCGWVVFEYLDYEVTAHSTGYVEVQRVSEDSSPHRLKPE